MQSAPKARPAYQPAVPIPIYRQLARELHATKAKLATLEAERTALLNQNQRLLAEVEAIAANNQSLREAIARGQREMHILLDQSDRRLETIVQLGELVTEPAMLDLDNVIPFETVTRLDLRSPDDGTVRLRIAVEEPPTVEPERLHTEVGAPVPAEDLTTELETDGPVSRLWVGLTVLLIVVLSFGAGYLLMSPLANWRPSNSGQR
ncbi:MAG TPA: hypothetical protein DCQ32_06855 [Cyanobacteria bacterium UBA8156]|jgi:hypothetical protein|nr:hypothetical protein [Cyanobacteria bacterium UBA8156]